MHQLVDVEEPESDEEDSEDEDEWEARKAAARAERERRARVMWAGPSRWLRVLGYTEGAAAGRLPVRRFGVTGERGRGNHQFHFPMGVCVRPGIDGLVYVVDPVEFHGSQELLG